MAVAFYAFATLSRNLSQKMVLRHFYEKCHNVRVRVARMSKGMGTVPLAESDGYAVGWGYAPGCRLGWVFLLSPFVLSLSHSPSFLLLSLILS